MMEESVKTNISLIRTIAIKKKERQKQKTKTDTRDSLGTNEKAAAKACGYDSLLLMVKRACLFFNVVEVQKILQ